MSTALAIAGVTAVLRDLLNDGLIDGDVASMVGSLVTVSALAPNRIQTDTNEKSQLNLFMYNPTPNQGWRNMNLPSFDSQGRRITSPPLALDLHYLVSAYGASDLHADIVLGYAMQLMHETPVLTRDSIRTTLGLSATVPGSSLPASLRALSTAELADQFEEIKICQEVMSNDELSKLWSAFQAPFRTSAAYLATVVLIERHHTVQAGLPVKKSNLVVLPFQRPVLESVEPQIVFVGGKLVVKGYNLKGSQTFAVFESGETAPDSVNDTRLEVTLPGGLLAGVRTIQVSYKINFLTPADPHRFLESNALAFALAPQITTTAPINAVRGANLTLQVSPGVGREQDVSVVFGERSFPVPSRPASDPPTSASITFQVPNTLPTGVFLLRIRVDGIDSPLGVDANGQYNAPTVTVT